MLGEAVIKKQGGITFEHGMDPANYLLLTNILQIFLKQKKDGY